MDEAKSCMNDRMGNQALSKLYYDEYSEFRTPTSVYVQYVSHVDVRPKRAQQLVD